LAERHLRSPRASTRPARARRGVGLWHRPEFLDLVSDLLFLFAAVALAWGAFSWVMSKPIFPLRELIVSTPLAQVNPAQLEYVARTSMRGNFFTVALDEARAAFEKVPWVRRAEVRRHWPDGIELAIEEHQAVAYWTASDSDETYLVNHQGELFEAFSDADMAVLSGPQGSMPALLERYRIYSRMLAPLDLRLAKVQLSARAAWQLHLDDGFTIVLGREQDHFSLDARFERFIAAWGQMRQSVGVRLVRADLRYPGGFTLTPADAAAVPAAQQGTAGKR
jgi:cell division protein FtsQ